MLAVERVLRAKYSDVTARIECWSTPVEVQIARVGRLNVPFLELSEHFCRYISPTNVDITTFGEAPEEIIAVGERCHVTTHRGTFEAKYFSRNGHSESSYLLHNHRMVATCRADTELDPSGFPSCFC